MLTLISIKIRAPADDAGAVSFILTCDVGGAINCFRGFMQSFIQL